MKRENIIIVACKYIRKRECRAKSGHLAVNAIVNTFKEERK